LAEAVLAEAVLAEAVLAEAVLAEAVLAEAVLAGAPRSASIVASAAASPQRRATSIGVLPAGK
jgi:hypothetical protein